MRARVTEPFEYFLCALLKIVRRPQRALIKFDRDQKRWDRFGQIDLDVLNRLQEFAARMSRQKLPHLR
jgi:hypothetical protein